MELIESVKESAIRHLSVTEGVDLEITSNLTSSGQVDAVLECLAHSYLGSKYVIQRKDMLLRLTDSFQGRHRSDIVEIGKASDYIGGN